MFDCPASTNTFMGLLPAWPASAAAVAMQATAHQATRLAPRAIVLIGIRIIAPVCW
jgi:hypothetical protein